MKPNSDEYEVNVDFWLAQLGSSDTVCAPYLLGKTLSSPLQLAAIERVRRNFLGDFAELCAVPVDVFVFAYGEPHKQDTTKVGGTPYRPADIAWPTVKGVPMTFVAQFNFSRSRECVGATPGDVLLVFARDAAVAEDDLECIRFEWYPLGLERLVRPENVPETSWKIVVCHGLRHRSFDFGNLELCLQRLRERQLWDNECDLKSMCRWTGMKIGGLPCMRGTESPLNGDMDNRLLCMLTDIVPLTNCNWPWANRRAPIALESLNWEHDVLYTWDGFTLNLSRLQDGRVTWHILPL